MCWSATLPLAAQSATNLTGFLVRWGYYGSSPWCYQPCIRIAVGGASCIVLTPDGRVEGGFTGLTNVTAIAAAEYHSLALLQDGTVRASGRIYDGIGGYVEDTVPPGLSNVVAISAGNNHSLALKSDGTLVAWGNNTYGQTNVAGMRDVVAIAAGGFHNLALDKNGVLSAWGYNRWNQTTIPGGLGEIAAITAGDCHNLVLRSNGTVVAWGWNANGQATVPEGLTNVVAVAGGYNHSLALKAEGTVVAWGNNYSGESTVPAGLCKVVAIAAGGHNSAALVRPLEFQQALLSQTAYQGETIQFNHPANGYPLAFYLCFSSDGRVACCGTNACLSLSNVQFTDSGPYVVVATNIFSAVTSAPAALKVIPAVQQRPVPAVNVSGSVGHVLTVEYSDHLGASSLWSALETFTPTGAWRYTFDTSVSLPPQRYYRAWQESAGPATLVPPILVPAITVTGTPPQSIRVDCINRYGPTNDWSSLGTVALTQPSQYLFDVTAPGQPARLYRLVPVP